jgi:hypothetical protein
MDSKHNEMNRPYLSAVLIWTLLFAPLLVAVLRDLSGTGKMILECAAISLFVSILWCVGLVCYYTSRIPHVAENKVYNAVRWFGTLPPMRTLLRAGLCIGLLMIFPGVLLAALLLQTGKIGAGASSFNVLSRSKLASSGYRIGEAYSELVMEYRALWVRVLNR